jgi:hypothetical protein
VLSAFLPNPLGVGLIYLHTFFVTAFCIESMLAIVTTLPALRIWCRCCLWGHRQCIITASAYLPTAPGMNSKARHFDTEQQTATVGATAVLRSIMAWIGEPTRVGSVGYVHILLAFLKIFSTGNRCASHFKRRSRGMWSCDVCHQSYMVLCRCWHLE